MTYYIAIPHTMPAQEWFKTDEELSEDDRYIAGDHDLSNILAAENEEELKGLLAYEGHQAGRVHVIAEEILTRDFAFAKKEITYELLQEEGEFLDSTVEGTCRLYLYNGHEYVVLCDNSVITREEDNAFEEEVIFPYNK